MNMFKKLFSVLVLASSLAACTGDYTDWAKPQHYDQPATVTFGNGSVTEVGLIDFAKVSTATVQVCTIKAPTSSDESYTPMYKITLGDGTVDETYDLAADGSIDAEILQNFILDHYGKAPYERIIPAYVSMWVSNGTTAIRTLTSEVFNIKAKLDAPELPDNLYLLGAPADYIDEEGNPQSGWNPTLTRMPFSHSDKSVYDDPIFTITFPVSNGDTWFAFTDDKTVETADWSYVYGCKEGNGKNYVGEPGLYDRRSSLTDDGSFMVSVADDAKYIRMTIDVLNGTYLLEKVNFSEFCWVPGAANGWSFNCKLKGNNAGLYTGYAALGGDWGWKVTTADNWDEQYGYGGSEGVLVKDGGNIMEATETGFYFAEINLADLTYNLTPINTISIIGSVLSDGWDVDADMEWIRDGGGFDYWTFTADCKAGEFKFRMNHDWGKNLGGTFDSLGQDWSNLQLTEAGTYTITLYPSYDGGSHCTVIKH